MGCDFFLRRLQMPGRWRLGRCFTVVDFVADGSPACLSLDEENERRLHLAYRRAHRQV